MYIVLLRYSVFGENVCMLYLNAAPFYIRDLNILGFWYPHWGPGINPPHIPRNSCTLLLKRV